MDIVNRIDDLLAKQGKKKKALVASNRVNFLQTLTDLKKRNTVLNADVDFAIAAYFKVSVRYLLTGEYGKDELTLDEGVSLHHGAILMLQEQFEAKALLNHSCTCPENNTGGIIYYFFSGKHI